MTSAELTKAELALLAATMARGVRKRLSGLSAMPLEGNLTETPTQVADTLDAFVRLRQEVEDRHAAWQAALQRFDAQEPAMVATMASVTKFVRAAFGNAADALADFGIKPIKPRTPLTADEMAAAVAKREATRQARHTMGDRQKADVHGNVTGVQVVPIVSGSQATPAVPPPAPARAIPPAEPPPTKA